MQPDFITRTQFLARFPTVRHFRIACREEHIASLVPHASRHFEFEPGLSLGDRILFALPWSHTELTRVWELCSGQVAQ